MIILNSIVICERSEAIQFRHNGLLRRFASRKWRHGVCVFCFPKKWQFYGFLKKDKKLF